MSRASRVLSVAVLGMAVLSQAGCNKGWIKPGTGSEGCWVKLYREDQFRGGVAVLEGPTRYEDMHWIPDVDPEEIGSIETGPATWVRVYNDTDFDGQSMSFGPGTRIGNLRGYGLANEGFQSIEIFSSEPAGWTENPVPQDRR